MGNNAGKKRGSWRPMRLLASACVALCCFMPMTSTWASEPPVGQYALEKVVMLLRHGVRAGFHPERDARYSGKPWADFGYPKGQLTAQGRDALVLWGAYHRTLLNRAGLFAEGQALSVADVLVETSPMQRTRESAYAFLSGISPGFVVPPASADAPGWFIGPELGVAIPDPDKARAAAIDGLGMSLSAAQVQYRPALQVVERALSIQPGRLADRPWRIEVENEVRFTPMRLVEDMLETVRMQYANGIATKDVAFGNAPDADAVTALMGLRLVYWRAVHRPRYMAVQLYAPLFEAMSRTLLDDQAAMLQVSGNAEPDTTSSGPKLAVYVGHDTNIASIGGILGFQWKTADGLENDQKPGGFIMLERLREVKTGERFVRVSYHAQTLDQLRNLSALGIASDMPAASIAQGGSARLDPASVPYRVDFLPSAEWGGRADGLIPLKKYHAMVQEVVAESKPLIQR